MALPEKVVKRSLSSWLRIVSTDLSTHSSVSSSAGNPYHVPSRSSWQIYGRPDIIIHTGRRKSTSHSCFQQIRSFNDACGLVGYPNVGKSTLFNAFVGSQKAEASNFPFCTIEPNVLKIAVPDEKLEKLAELEKTSTISRAFVEIRDIAGLIKGASEGAGMGNQFLSNVRGCAVIFQVVRCFPDDRITVVEGSPIDLDPVREFEAIQGELRKADLQYMEGSRLASLEKRAKRDTFVLKVLLPAAQEILTLLKEEKPASAFLTDLDRFGKTYDDDFRKSLLNHGKDLTNQLLTWKPTLVCCNVAEDDAKTGNKFSEKLQAYLVDRKYAYESIVISSSLEAEAATLMQDDKDFATDYLESFGLKKQKIGDVLTSAKKLLKLKQFYTAGEIEAKAWFYPEDATAPEAASAIHSDFYSRFMAVEIWKYDDVVGMGSKSEVRARGKVLRKGKDTILEDGDVVEFVLDQKKAAVKKAKA